MVNRLLVITAFSDGIKIYRNLSSSTPCLSMAGHPPRGRVRLSFVGNYDVMGMCRDFEDQPFSGSNSVHKSDIICL